MTEKLSIRSVIYKLLAARKKCYRFFAKKRKAWSIIQKKKIILCLKFYCSSLFTNDSAILCFFFPPNLPTLLTALVWPVLGQKKCVSFATMIPIYYYDQNTRNIQSELVVLFTLFNHRSKLSLTCGMTSSGCKNLFDKQDYSSLRQW